MVLQGHRRFCARTASRSTCRLTPRTAARRRKSPGVYFIDADGRRAASAWRVGNEFSDHKFEKKNYLNLAGSKIRTCALGPELVIDPEFQSVPGKVKSSARENFVVKGNSHRRK
jgi:hypothetical protein